MAAALDVMAAAGQPVPVDGLTRYARAVQELAAAEVGLLAPDNRDEALTYALLGSVLAEPVILGLRRMAHEDQSVRRFSGRT